MIKVNTIVLSLAQLANSDTVIITEVFPYKEYIDGKATDKVVGYRYTCVCPANKYEQIQIKVAQAEPVVKPEELTGKNQFKAKPKNFEGRFYRDRNGEYQLSAKATAMELLP